ncbi:entericidin A/B family lipoprotein [Oceanibacterium hippocampi]|uniref:Entericidin B membrane lipoprotein n=1 Tax=Oceanibacterium hippocampi TaxID=745714 RepID=A0A1Y5TWE3_9PROT|nr:entericidin A/B family lipoprotein [Oceanibacterium hippocampi]SLN73846.1 entericidin B membrane lipoprotein [Oceanibacterium hippocampi]
MTSLLSRDTAKLCLAFLLLGMTSVALPACNTVEGAGQDIEAAGDSISDTARDAEAELSD